MLKNFIYVVLFAQLFLSLFQNPSLSNLSITEIEALNNEPTQIYTFRINENMPLYECAVFISEPTSGSGNGRIEQIKITDTSSDALLQTIFFTSDTYPFNEDFMTSAAYFIDVTFDGNIELLVPLERSARYMCFNAFIWDDVSKQFVNHPSFETVYNPSIDFDNKRILSTTSGDQRTNYIIRVFENNEFVVTNSIGWGEAWVEPDAIPNADEFIHFSEYRPVSGIETIVNDFYVHTDFFSWNSDNLDPRLVPYFEPDSFWDLENPRWRSPLWADDKFVLSLASQQ